MAIPTSKLRIIVGGMVGQYPLGGVAWDYFHYVLALAEMGHDVYYYEDTGAWPLDPVKGHPSDDGQYPIGFMTRFFQTHAPHLSDRWHYVLIQQSHHGMSKAAFDEVARTADIFLNVSAACKIPDELNPKCITVFMDTDPGYNQIVLHTQPSWAKTAASWLHDLKHRYQRHLTYAENIWADDCLVPRLDVNWLPTRPVVTMNPWQNYAKDTPPKGSAFTTVMSWNYYSELILNGVRYDAKAPEFERFMQLPKKTDAPLQVAISGHMAPMKELLAAGWTILDAPALTITAESYIDFIRNSFGEWSIAKNVYAATKSGWFSCRSACYLAAGRPCVVQDTAWSRYVPSGAGVWAFTTMDECTAALETVMRDPAKARAQAFEIAREYLAPDKVLPPMLESIETGNRVRPPSI